MDMLRFDRFTAGRYWVDDYGYPNREADFRVLCAPIRPITTSAPGTRYPPMLVTTADTDDRVVPGAQLQIYRRDPGRRPPAANPHLIRIETRAGHASGKPTDKQIAEYTDMYAFIAHFTGLRVPRCRGGGWRARAVTARLSRLIRALVLVSAVTGAQANRRPWCRLSAVQRTGRWAPSRRPVTARCRPCRRKPAADLAHYRSEHLGVLAPRGWHCLETYGSNGASLFVSPDPPPST